MITLLAGQRQEKETKRAMQACNDYLRLGPGRSLAKLLQMYPKCTPNVPQTSPTKNLKTLKRWSADYFWQQRADAYDEQIELQKTAEAERRRIEALQTGIALDYERVLELKDIFAQLKAELDTEGLYYTDKKVSAKGDVVLVDVFNKPLVDALRATLDDIAKEVGGRITRSQSVNFKIPYDKLPLPALERIANDGENPLLVLMDYVNDSTGDTSTEG